MIPADALDGALRQVRFFFIGAVSVGVPLLLTATVLSVYKPWGHYPVRPPLRCSARSPSHPAQRTS